MTKYKKENCQTLIRRVVTLSSKALTATITIAGTHAFEWSVNVTKSNGYNKTRSFAGRTSALEELSRLKRQFRELGDCVL